MPPITAAETVRNIAGYPKTDITRPSSGAMANSTRSKTAVNVAVNGSAVLRYWCDKASSTRAWTTPGGVTRRTTTNGSGRPWPEEP